jgi:hypothetical protein
MISPILGVSGPSPMNHSFTHRGETLFSDEETTIMSHLSYTSSLMIIQEVVNMCQNRPSRNWAEAAALVVDIVLGRQVFMVFETSY